MDDVTKIIMDRLAEMDTRIDARFGRIEQRMSEAASREKESAVHGGQIADLRKDMDSVKAQMGKHNLIAATLGAIGAAIVLTIKYVAGR